MRQFQSFGGRGVMVLGVCALVFAAGVVGPVQNAGAQQVRVTATMRESGGGTVARRSVERYADLLGLDAAQRESALTIHDGYAAAMKEAQKARRSAVEEVSRSAQDSGDHAVFMEKMPGIEQEFKVQSGKVEKGFFDDVRSLLNGTEQEQRWPRVERMRRREVELRRGQMAGESLDLTEVVGGLKLDRAAAQEVAPVLDEYEFDLDAQLKGRQRVAADAPAFEPGKGFDMEKMQAGLAQVREAGLKVKECNERFARKIEAMLPEERRAEFRTAVRMGTFPSVYRPSRVSRDLEKALALGDLTAEQRESLTELKRSYERDLRPANDAWAAAISNGDKTDEGGGSMATSGGGVLTIRNSDEPKALADARKARRELDEKARERVKAVLNETQMAAIKPAAEEVEGFEGSQELIIRSGDR